MTNFDAVFTRSVDKPEEFWAEAAKGLDWYKECDKVLDSSNPPFYRWFSGGKMNTCYNAVDRHVKNGRGNQIAIIYDSPVTNTIAKISYSEFLEKVSLLQEHCRAKG